MTSYNEEIIRIHEPTINEFNALAENKPFIITGVVNKWPGFAKWTVAYFKEKYGDLILPVRDNRYIDYWQYKNPYQNSIAKMSFFDYLTNVIDHAEVKENNYYMVEQNPDFFPGLNNDFEVPIFIRNMHYISGFWLSGKNAMTRLHHDLGHNFLAQVAGEKKLILYRPNLSNMYPYPRNGVSQVKLESPDYNKFPRFKSLQPIICELKAGEMLYLPSCWWHEVHSMDIVNISVNFFFRPTLKYALSNAKPLLRAKIIQYRNLLEKKFEFLVKA